MSIIRATTGGVLRGYRSNLMNSFIGLNKARNTVLTQRNFNSYAEDPASAAQAFKLRKARMQAESQYNICDDTYRKYQQGFSALQGVSEILDTKTSEPLKTLEGVTLESLNDPEGDARGTLSKAISQMAETIVQNMNTKYGENFVFAGADGQNVPFEVKNNKLYYRGVPVDASVPDVATDPNGQMIEVDANGVPTVGGGYYLKTEGTTTMAADDYPELFGMYNNTNGTYTGPLYKNTFVEYNADGSLYDGTNGTGGYIARVAAAGDTGVTNTPPATVPADQLISFADYEDYVVDAGYATGSVVTAVTKDLNPPPNVLKDANGDPVKVQDPTTKTTRAAGEYYLVQKGDPQVISKADYEQAQEDVEKLEFLANEDKYFVDIGLGFQENNKGELIESSAFDASLNGLTFLGYGTDADGDPKNIYSMVLRLSEIAGRVKDGEAWTTADYDEFHGLVKKLENARSDFKVEFTDMSAATEKLKNNLQLLEDQQDTLVEQYAGLEDVDMAEAITSFIWAQYCYNAALKVGNSILSESLMDYLT